MEDEKQLEVLKELFPEVDTDKGLYYCANNMALYLKLLRAFAEREKAGLINSYYEQKDWKKYITEVHALKSTSRTLGFMDLGDMSEKMQYAAQDVNMEYVDGNHGELIDHLVRVEDAIKQSIV